MKSNLLKKLIVATSLLAVSAPIVGLSETKVHANTENESEIKAKQDKFNVPPSTLSPELFSEITDTTRTPYNSVGTVFVKGTGIASGVLIGKNTVLTNSHVVELAKQDPSKVIFTPATSRNEEGIQITPYGQFLAEDINEHPYGGGIDLAIIKLKPNDDGKSAGDSINPAKVPDNIDVQNGDKISLLGYPNNYSAHTLHRSEIEVFDADLGHYYGYTEEGNSGSGIFDLRGDLVGIHVGKGGKYNLPKGYFFDKKIGPVYSVDETFTTLGEDLKKRAELQAK